MKSRSVTFRKRTRALILFLIVGSVSIAGYNLLDIAEASPSAPKMFVDPPSVISPALTPGETFSVDVKVSDAEYMYSWQVYMAWDGAVLEISDYVYGGFLSDQPEGSTYNTRIEPNFCILAEATKGNHMGKSAEEGLLVTITFLVKAMGETTLAIDHATLTKYVYCITPPNLQAVYDFTKENGYFSNQEAVHTNVAFSLTPSPAYVGQTVTLLGNLTDVSNNGIAGASILVKFSTDGGSTWHPAGILTTNGTGWFGPVSGTLSATGTYLINASYSGSPTYRPSSSQETLTVLKMNTRVFFTLTPNPAIVNEAVALLGNLTDQFNSPVGGAPVEIYYSADDGVTWNMVGTLTTNGTGWFGPVSGTLSATGTYKVAVVYRGSDKYNFSYHIETLQVNPSSAPESRSKQ